MILLTAPRDLAGTPSYESAERLLLERYDYPNVMTEDDVSFGSGKVLEDKALGSRPAKKPGDTEMRLWDPLEELERVMFASAGSGKGEEELSPCRESENQEAAYSTVGRLKQVSVLYLLAHEDGSMDHRTYRRIQYLCGRRGVAAYLLYPSGWEAVEVGEFTLSVIEESERTEQVFAVVIPDASSHGSSVSNDARKKASGESPRKSS